MSARLHVTELREGGSQDVPSVDAIMQDAFDPEYGEAWTAAQCLGMLSLPGVWLVIASVDGADVGFALARSTGEEAELLLLATRRSARRRGVAGKLLRAILSEARARGVVDIHLEMRAGNEAAHLYGREGFTMSGQRPAYYRGKSGQHFDAQTFSRKIS